MFTSILTLGENTATVIHTNDRISSVVSENMDFKNFILNKFKLFKPEFSELGEAAVQKDGLIIQTHGIQIESNIWDFLFELRDLYNFDIDSEFV